MLGMWTKITKACLSFFKLNNKRIHFLKLNKEKRPLNFKKNLKSKKTNALNTIKRKTKGQPLRPTSQGPACLGLNKKSPSLCY